MSAAPLTVEDLLSFVLPTELAVAPDGRHLAYTLLALDAAANKRRSGIWLLDLAAPTTAPRPFTAGQHRDRQPAWSPASTHLAFVSDREHGAQIWLMPSDGGEPRKLTDMRYGATKPCWSPDGRTLFFLAEVHDGEGPFIDTDVEKAQREKAEADQLRHITRLQYRWDGEGERVGRTHLWAVDVADASAPAATPRQLTQGDYDHGDLACSPDGTQIACVSDRSKQRDANRTDDIWVLTLATGAMTQISASNSEVSRPSWSPDSQMIAWYDQPVLTAHSFSNTHVMLATRADQGWSTPRDLLAGHDITTGQAINTDLGAIRANPPTWNDAGQSLFVTACERGTINLWQIALGGTLRGVTAGGQQIGTFAFTADQRLVAIITTPEHAPDIAQFHPGDVPAQTPERWLTDANPWLRERTLGTLERFDYVASDDWQLEGWILWPPEAALTENATKRWPVVLQIHGGPHGFYGPSFFALLHLIAGAGYAVVFLNPRGSISYGETFARACDRDWGGADYRDIMAGLDAALTHDRLDGDRLAVTGTSYGGYMTNWIISHTDRFKAAVTINSVTNLVSIFGTGDIDATFGIPEYGGTLWERWDYFVERSPITYAPQITTPTRIIGAEEDWRCPIEQSEQLYTALKLLGRTETDFWRVPKASHSINSGSPKQLVAQRRAILEWITRFVPAGPR